MSAVRHAPLVASHPALLPLPLPLPASTFAPQALLPARPPRCRVHQPHRHPHCAWRGAGGVLKYGVEESYITHVDHTGEWAGKHFIGRKVRIPHLGGRDADKNGVIRGYNEQWETYIVAMESGAIETDVRYEEMKVPYELIKR